MSPSNRPTLTERRAEELRMTIALTARDIFLADGSTSATVERICDAVGVAPRTFQDGSPRRSGRRRVNCSRVRPSSNASTCSPRSWRRARPSVVHPDCQRRRMIDGHAAHV